MSKYYYSIRQYKNKLIFDHLQEVLTAQMIEKCAVRMHRVWAQVLQTLMGVALGISWWECAARTLEPLANTRASSAEFCNTILL